jgi:hypothetical protein
MPNWCNSHIIISGDERKMLLLRNDVENDFNIEWDLSYNEFEFEFNNDHIVMTSLTAWSPPIGFVSNLCKVYGLTAVMNYDERGSDICGRVFVDVNGEIDHEEYKFNEGHYHFDNGHFWEGLVYSDLEDALEEGKTKDQFILEYPYLDLGDKKELEKMYDEYMIENLKTENNE